MVRAGREQHTRYLLAFDDQNRIVGIAVLRAEPITLFEIIGLGVRPDSQGQGVGGSLVARALDLAASRCYACAQTSVFADNAQMLRLLLSLGFVPVDVDHRRRADGADLVVLQKTGLKLPADA